MYPVRLSVTFAVLFVLGNLAGSGRRPAMGQPAAAQAPMEVTTDTPEYCQHLASRVHDLVQVAAAPLPREVASLSVEGQRMCEHGQTRGGIMRLRRALMLMMHNER